MKRICLCLVLFLSFLTNGYTQTIKTDTIIDWNKMSKRSGFFESQKVHFKNAPADALWYWGINVSSSRLTSAAGQFNGQIAFAINRPDQGVKDVTEMYIRSTNYDGEGAWAKVLHSLGNHTMKGKLTVEEVEIRIISGADFVFNSNYKLKPLSEVESFVKENKHLPEIPSEKEMVENGLNVNEMQIKLLQKIEELTLYVIELDKKNKEQEAVVTELKEENRQIKLKLEL